jgi:tRNA pseudouridine38-40 synthase
MQRYRLQIEYQGTRYRGWQAQLNARSVQGEIRGVVEDVWGACGDLQGSGRTDAGVHAISQVAHVDLPQAVAPRDVVFRINERLPHDITVIAAQRADARFHARHHAQSRSYLYQVSRRRTSFGKPFVWWVRDSLDAAAMAAAATHLVGMHDFRSLADKRHDEEKSSQVLLEEAVVAESGDLILFRFRASHFLWKMVRRMVGTLAEVGRGSISADEYGRRFRKGTLDSARLTAPPSGLFLEEVIYPGETWRRDLRPVEMVPRW